MTVKHPRFCRPNVGRSSRSRVKDVWRKPRGIDNKKRVHKRYMGESPSIGWRGKRTERHIHPSGFPEVLVSNLSEIKSLKGKRVVVRIASAVGARKRPKLVELAEKMNLKVVN